MNLDTSVTALFHLLFKDLSLNRVEPLELLL